MRVGIVCPYSLDVPGGVQNHVKDLAEALRGRGHDGSRNDSHQYRRYDRTPALVTASTSVAGTHRPRLALSRCTLLGSRRWIWSAIPSKAVRATGSGSHRTTRQPVRYPAVDAWSVAADAARRRPRWRGTVGTV